MKAVSMAVISVVLILAAPGINVRAQKLERVAVGYGSISTNYLPLWIAKEAGIFLRNGLDVDMVFFTSSPTAFMALLAGETAIAINPGPDVVNAHLRGADVESLDLRRAHCRDGPDRGHVLGGEPRGRASSADVRDGHGNAAEGG